MIFCDIHTHILPGIDDGAADWKMSLGMVKASWKAGVRTIIATPHYLPWKEDNHTGEVELLCRELMYRSREQLGIEMEVLPGQEIFYHTDMEEKLRNGEILTLAHSRYILVEFETDASGQKILDGLGHLRQAGYLPILAHMERYSALRSGNWLQELKERGILLQMNMASIEGMRFKPNVYWCRRQITDNMVDLMASDMHNLTTRRAFNRETLSWLKKNVKSTRRKQLFGGLPQ